MTVAHGRTLPRHADCFVLMMACLLAFTPSAASAASSPFGVGLPDGQLPGAGWFPELAGKIMMWQAYFNAHITAAVHAIRQDNSAVWTLMGLSFLYGVLHAAGPGHGKAVVSTYILANRQTLRNGVALAFIASLAQAGGAIALIVVASMIFRITSVALTQATFEFEILSDILVICLGLWLVWSKIVRPARSPKFDFSPAAAFTAPRLANGNQQTALAFRAIAVDEFCEQGAPVPQVDRGSCSRIIGKFSLRGHDCPECGQMHIPSGPITAGSLDWRKAWSVIASTALRPCTGALIVLVFSVSQGLFLAGVAATLAMGIGTALTVALLATLAVSARHTALVMTRADSVLGRKILRGAEIGGALAVLIFGAILLAATLFS